MVTMKNKRFKVFYFIGCDELGFGGERKLTIIWARSEEEAEHIFKRSYIYDSLGWIEEIPSRASQLG